jgi:hypothetical protein
MVAVRKDKRKEAGHYSGLDENKRSKTFDAHRSLSFAHVQLHFRVQQRNQNNTFAVSGLSPVVVTYVGGIMSFTDADLLKKPVFIDD